MVYPTLVESKNVEKTAPPTVSFFIDKNTGDKAVVGYAT
jgi:hypothetical protein